MSAPKAALRSSSLTTGANYYIVDVTYIQISDTTVEHFRDVSEAFNAAQLLNRCEHYLRYHDVVATDASQVFVKMTDEDT